MLVQWYYWKASFAWMTISRFYTSYKPLIAFFPNHALITNWSVRFISICNALNCHIFHQCIGIISTFAILLRFDSYSVFSCRRAYCKHYYCFLWCTFRKHTCTKRSVFSSFSVCNHKALKLINRHNIHPKISPFTESWMACTSKNNSKSFHIIDRFHKYKPITSVFIP